MESQWIPTDPELWEIENYHRFLDARRRLLADAANEMLATLRAGVIPPAEAPPIMEQEQSASDATNLEDFDLSDEAIVLESANRLALGHGLPAGEMAHDIIDRDRDELITLDLAWPDGLQVGLSQPVALLIDEDELVRQTASKAGFRVFTTLADFRQHIERDIIDEVVW
ncbi:MAG: hypothetical protein F4X27_06005 [Chloroflexi bacterium]|nr:hypothetical protein [Chloroflexota bacterium]